MKAFSTLILAASAAALTVSAANADVVNRVTLSGTIVTVGTPVTRETASSTTITTKLVTQKISNNTILDALVQAGTLSNKTGYGLVEILNDDGTSRGFFARNTRTGDSVAVTASLLSGFTDSNLISADSSTSRTTPTGDTTETSSSAFTGVANSTISGTAAAVYIVGQSAGRNFTNRVAGEVVKIPYTSLTYTALIRGVSADHQVINAKLVSTGSVYVLANN